MEHQRPCAAISEIAGDAFQHVFPSEYQGSLTCESVIRFDLEGQRRL